ncbi:hypothetical protein DKX38_017684 [Salix brachista]|uniref:Yippee domain-containing protein n=1 Tax=Salix brachista TaxID=2182728 RepID=A0A5N5KWV4_9ROSI|nr:hypothetical protein DKX38_017684 [Salix brachista]
MGRISVVELEGRSYICKFCGAHFALPNQLVSKSYEVVLCCLMSIFNLSTAAIFLVETDRFSELKVLIIYFYES